MVAFGEEFSNSKHVSAVEEVQIHKW